MPKLNKVLGATSEIWQVFIRDSSSTIGAGLTGLVFNSAGLTAYYHRDTDTTATAITLATMTVGTFTSSGFKEIDATNMPGWYQFCPPNAALASGAKSVGIHLKGATNMAPLPIEVQLTAVNPDDAVRYGMTALPNAAAEAAGGLYTRGTGAGQINQANNGQVDTNVIRIGGTTQTARDIGASVLLSPGTGTGQISITAGAITVGTNNDKTGYGLSAAAVQAVWDALTSALTTAGSIGKLLVDNINATISSRLASASYTAPDNTSIAAIKVVTDKFVFTVTNKVDATIQLASDFAQGAADKVWLTAARTLTAFGFSVTITAGSVQAIWDAATSALTTAGSIGKKLADWVLGTDNKVLLSTDAQAGVTIPTVTNLTALTSALAEPTAVIAANASLRDKINWFAALSRNKITQTATTQTLLADDGSTPIAASTVSDDGTTATRGEFS